MKFFLFYDKIRKDLMNLNIFHVFQSIAVVLLFVLRFSHLWPGRTSKLLPEF